MMRIELAIFSDAQTTNKNIEQWENFDDVDGDDTCWMNMLYILLSKYTKIERERERERERENDASHGWCFEKMKRLNTDLWSVGCLVG